MAHNRTGAPPQARHLFVSPDNDHAGKQQPTLMIGISGRSSIST